MTQFFYGALAMFGMVCFVADAMAGAPGHAALVAGGVMCMVYAAHQRARELDRLEAEAIRHLRLASECLDAAVAGLAYVCGDPDGIHPAEALGRIGVLRVAFEAEQAAKS